MRILSCVAAAAALLACVPVALAHEGSPNFLSQINDVTPAADGVTVEVLNRDDRLLLHNTSGKTVLIDGYSEEPYARVEPDGTVSVNRNSEAYYINEERDGKVAVPESVDPDAAPQWEEISKTGRFEWHDHRMHWMAESDPDAVKDKDVRSKVFDWRVPIEVDGQPGEIAGTLFWTPVASGGPPLLPIILAVAVVIPACIAVMIVRRRRAGAAETAADGPAPEAW